MYMYVIQKALKVAYQFHEFLKASPFLTSALSVSP